MNFQLAPGRPLSDNSDMASEITLAERIRERLDDLDTNPFAAAESVGLERNFINDVLIGKKKSVRGDGLFRLAEALKTTPEWLSREPGASKKVRLEPRRMSEEEEWRDHAADFERVDVDGVYDPDGYAPTTPGGTPELDLQAGAGEGTVGEVVALPRGREVYTGHRVVAEWLFPESWIEGELHADRARTFVVPIRGDSMLPTYQPGDRVLIDRSQNSLTEDTVYLISDGDSHPRVKRLVEVMFSKPRQVQVVSDNPAIDNQTVALADLTIIGRVVGVASRR